MLQENVVDTVVRLRNTLDLEVRNANFFTKGQLLEVWGENGPFFGTIEVANENMLNSTIRIKGGIPDFVKPGMLLVSVEPGNKHELNLS